MHLQVVTTLPNREEAEQIASELVSRRLAACVHVIGPVTSTYRWQGRVETAQEWQCVCKTRDDLYSQLEATIRELHSYDTPEILAMRVEAGSKEYLAWLDAELVPRGS